jgi:hypothetical protein
MARRILPVAIVVPTVAGDEGEAKAMPQPAGE